MRRGAPQTCEHHVDAKGVQHPGCGAPIYFVTVIPLHRKRGAPLRKIALNAEIDPAWKLPPSHAVTPDWRQCRPLSPDETPGPYEDPAITHFATCPHRRTT